MPEPPRLGAKVIAVVLTRRMLRRDTDGKTEFLTLSLWESMDAVKAFAGEDPEVAVFYPEDDRYLVERDLTVTHYDVARSVWP